MDLSSSKMRHKSCYLVVFVLHDGEVRAEGAVDQPLNAWAEMTN